MLNKIIDYLLVTVLVITMLMLMALFFEVVFGLFSSEIPIWMKWVLERNGGM